MKYSKKQGFIEAISNYNKIIQEYDRKNKRSLPMKTLFDLRKSKNPSVYSAINQLYKEEVNVFDFQDQVITPCIGCWDCWLKTPGNCVMRDRMTESYSDFVNSDTVILLLDTAQGFIDHRGKAFIDRTIPHYHPYIKLVDGESQHLSRYEKLPEIVFYFEREGLTEKESERIEDYLYRMAYQFQTNGYLIKDLDKPSLKLLQQRPAKRGLVPFGSTDPMEKLVIYNGSPRRKGSNTGLILEAVKDCLQDRIEIRDLKNRDHWNTWQDDFSSEEHILFMLPLYVHSMPSHVMDFIEGLIPTPGSITFFVQSGFPESNQSYYLEAYFEQLAKRLGRTYLGTVIKGGVEGLKARPTQSQQQMIKPMVTIIEDLLNSGKVNKDQWLELGKPVRLGVGGKAFLKTGVINFYWDQQLNANNAYQLKNQRPYQKNRRIIEKE